MRKLENPLVLAGAYCLNLYCDHENDQHGFREFPHEFTSETGGECRREARARGWKIHRDGTATCPKCTKALSPAYKRYFSPEVKSSAPPT